MKLRNILSAAALSLFTLGLTSCVGDLHVDSINPQQEQALNLDALFNKMYANLSVTGQKGPDGNGDLDDIDEGTSGLIRNLWNLNELSTDEAKCIWGDPGIPELNHNSWSDAHPLSQALYYRLYFGITLANHYLEETEGSSDTNVLTQRAEARFMRALHYYYLLDLYGNVSIVDKISKELSTQSTRSQVFDFIEKELKAIVGEGGSNEVLADKRAKYGRADKVAGYMLLARLYLNSAVYTGTARWQEAKTYADKVIASSYHLNTTGTSTYSAFQLLFMGDNDTNGAQDEILLPALYDGQQTQSWGGTLFILASTINSKVTDPAKGNYPVGTTQAWGGNRTTKQFAMKFFDEKEKVPEGNPFVVAKYAKDDRALFYTLERKMSMSDEGDFEKGFGYIKFLNVHAKTGSPSDDRFMDTDFPMLRVAEAYLTSAEADARMNNGACTSDGVSKINALRARANAAAVTAFDLEDLCDEWAREFAFEAIRRPTLIRFGKFGGQIGYKWEWMGGDKEGARFSENFNIFPIPVNVLNTNGNMKQNPGYAD